MLIVIFLTILNVIDHIQSSTTFQLIIRQSAGAICPNLSENVQMRDTKTKSGRILRFVRTCSVLVKILAKGVDVYVEDICPNYFGIGPIFR